MESISKNQLLQQSSLINNISNSVFPHLINGHLCEENKYAFSLSTNGYIAFACYNKVIILETIDKIRLCQNLNGHKYYVNKVLWCNENSFKLLSCDLRANIIVWNVIEGSVLTIITPQSKEDKQLLDVCWTKFGCDPNSTNKQSNILCLYSNNVFVVYDSDNGTCLWRKCFSSSSPDNTDYLIRSFEVDPFNEHNLLLSLSNVNTNNSECCFARLTDFYQKGHLSIYQIFLANSEEVNSGSPANSNHLKRYVNLIGNNTFSRNQLAFLNVTHLLEYIKIIHHSSNLDQILVAFEREIHLIDLNFKQVICVIRIENNCGNISDIYSCWQRNAIVCLHQNGSISFRIMQKKKRRKEHIGTDVMELNYVPIAISDGLRLTKFNKIFGFEINKINELEIYLISNNEKINVYKLYSPDVESQNHNILSLKDYIDLDEYIGKKERSFNLIMYKYFNCITKGGKHVIRTGPHLIYKNWFHHRPLVAIGDSNGIIQIFNLATNQLEKQCSIHTVAIRGIEWVNLNVILSYAYGNNGTKLCNELKITDINTCYSVLIREERNNESGPIEILKVSHFKNYFIISFKNDPFEIWDLRNLCCLKQMSTFPPNITSFEWIPVNNSKDSKNANRTKEYFMVTNSDSELYHFCVDNNNVKEILSTPHLSGGITATAWKNDQLLFGDLDGNITLWNLRTKVSKAECTLRGPIRKFSFGPGKNYLKLLVLFNDGVDLWNTKEMKLEAQIKYPRDIEFKIDDIDWASTDRPMLLTPEGFLLIFDSKLKVFHSAINFSSNSLLPINDLNDDSTESNEAKKFKFDFKLLGKINYEMFSNAQKLKLSSDLINDKLMNMIDLDYVDKSILLAKILGRLDLLQFFELVKHYCKNDYRVDTFFENFVQNDYFKEMQRDKIAVYELKRTRQEHNEICNEYHLYLGNDQRTVQLLLETDTSLKNLYLKDSLKACLISLLLQSEKNSTNLSHPVIKLVATNLIANESTDEGIQLLFIIGKIIDACRYLQSNNSWKKSLFLSKTNLTKDEFIEVNSRWPDYLSSCKKDKDKLFALVSLEMHEKVINYLMDRNEFKFASLYCDICIEFNLIDKNLYNLLKKVYQKYIHFLKEANLPYLIPNYQHRINYLEEKVDKFKLDNYEDDLVYCENRKLNLEFKKGYFKNWDDVDILTDMIVEAKDNEKQSVFVVKKEDNQSYKKIIKDNDKKEGDELVNDQADQ